MDATVSVEAFAGSEAVATSWPMLLAEVRAVVPALASCPAHSLPQERLLGET